MLKSSVAPLDLAALVVLPWPLLQTLHPSRLPAARGDRASLKRHLGVVMVWGAGVGGLLFLVPTSSLPLAAAMALAFAYWHRRGRADFGERQGLPPGALIPFDPGYRRDPQFHRCLARHYGPIAKFSPSLLKPVFVVSDFSSARRFLENHDGEIRPPHRSFTTLVPGDVLRCMEGQHHRRHRAFFSAILNRDMVGANAPGLRATIARELEHCAAMGEQRLNGNAFGTAIEPLVFALLLPVLFGPKPGDRAFDGLVHDFRRLWPEGHRFDADPPSREAYQSLLARLRDLVSERSVAGERPQASTSHLDALILALEGREPDETVLGNLVYMTSSGVQDLRGLFLWLTHFAGAAPQALDAVAREPADAAARGMAEAFVRETLRLAQSEFIRRRTLAPVELGGFAIPADHDVIIAMRAAHANPDHFDDPARFDPTRHLERPVGVNHYAPFGVGKHACPAAAMVVALAALYVRELAAGWQVQLRDPEALSHDRLHWEPNGRCSLVAR